MKEAETTQQLEEELSQMRQALASRGDIGVAKGLLMERYSLDEDAAFDLLRRWSSERNLKVRDLAAELARSRAFPSTRRRRVAD